MKNIINTNIKEKYLFEIFIKKVFINYLMRFISLPAIYFSLVCDYTSTKSLFNGDVIPDSAYSYQIIAPSTIENNTSFYIEIETLIGGNRAVSYTGPATISLLGSGLISGNQALTFTDGKASTNLTYNNPDAAAGSTTLIYLVVTDDSRPAITATSEPIQVGVPAFTVTTPNMIEEGKPFLISIQSVLDGSPYLSYYGPIGITASGNGTITVLSAPISFDGGLAEVIVQYDSTALSASSTESFFITVQDSFDSTQTGSSAVITAGKAGFELVTPTAIQTGIPFSVTLKATLYGVLDTSYVQSLTQINFTENGNGTLSIISSPGYFISGSATLTMVYTDNSLATGSTSALAITATDTTEASRAVTSSSITVSVPVSLDHFEVSLPLTIYQNDPFAITITAIGTDAQIYTPYNGTVLLTTTTTDSTTGNLSVASGTGFVNGVLSINNATYDAVASGLQIHMTDAADSTKTGASRFTTVFGSSLTAQGVPIDSNADGTMDAARLTFSVPVGTNSYKIWRGSTLLGTVFASSATYYTDTGLTESTTAYDYLVEAYNNTNVKLKSASVSVLLRPCTIISAGVGDSITVSSTWTVAASPYCVNSNVTLSGTGVVLTIEPGVNLLFADNVGISVASGASINAVGTGILPILFTTKNFNPVAGSWNGVTLQTTALVNNIAVVKNLDEIISETIGTQGSVFKYANFSYAKNAVIANVPVWVEYSLFMKNYVNGGGGPGGGAGIRILGSNYSVVRNSMFVQNVSAGCGNTPGDIDISNANAGAVVRNNNFFKSYSASCNSGGGVLDISYTAISSTIYGNTFNATYSATGSGGAIYITSSSNNVIRKNIFQDTYAPGDGGAIYIQNGVSGHKILENTFQATHAYYATGGAIYISGSGSDVIHDNVFIDTYTNASLYPSNGGAIAIGSGSYDIIYNNYFRNTRAIGSANGIGGGAIMVAGISHSTQIMNNTFDGVYANKTSTTGLNVLGGAIFFNNATSSGLVVNNNYFLNSYASASTPILGKGGAIGIGGINLTSPVFAQNSCINALASGVENCFYSEEDGAFSLDSWWWGGLAPADPAVCTTGLCETTISGKPTIANSLTSAPTLCCANPNASGCVGANILPAGVVCQ